VLQLTPEGIEWFDAAVSDVPGSATAAWCRAYRDRASASGSKDFMDPEYLALRALVPAVSLAHGAADPATLDPKPDKATQRRLDKPWRFKVTPASVTASSRR